MPSPRDLSLERNTTQGGGRLHRSSAGSRLTCSIRCTCTIPNSTTCRTRTKADEAKLVADKANAVARARSATLCRAAPFADDPAVRLLLATFCRARRDRAAERLRPADQLRPPDALVEPTADRSLRRARRGACPCRRLLCTGSVTLLSMFSSLSQRTVLAAGSRVVRTPVHGGEGRWTVWLTGHAGAWRPCMGWSLATGPAGGLGIGPGYWVLGVGLVDPDGAV